MSEEMKIFTALPGTYDKFAVGRADDVVGRAA